MNNLLTDLNKISALAKELEEENDAFRGFLKKSLRQDIDELVFALNDKITPQIDCTKCGNCCKSLMIGVTPAEAERLAVKMETSVEEIKEKYLEVSDRGAMLISAIPCHFLKETKCTIYEDRFSDCREFPHLHHKNFTGRLFSTLMHYAVCPIIFNVVEELKVELNFKKI